MKFGLASISGCVVTYQADSMKYFQWEIEGTIMRNGYLTVIAMTLFFTSLFSSCSQDNSAPSQTEKAEEWGATRPDENVVRSQPEDTSAHLKLKLKQGDRFPLRKVVEQELIQDSQAGSTNQIATRLELLFAISVIEKVEDRTRLQVRYEQVKYQHRIGDQLTAFDSTRNASNLPVSFQAYRDMVGDGFTFWIGPENQIVSVEGFAEFISRCLRNVPEAERNQVALGIEAGSGESGIANFIDNSIGLLPYGGNYHPGDTWERPSHIGRPVPMLVQNQYTLKDLGKESATIDIRGKIIPSTTMTSTDEQNGVRVTVKGGETLGSCTIFRETGLPQRSRVEQNIEMTVMLSGAQQFDQRKKVITTIESFPMSASSEPHRIQLGEHLSRELEHRSGGTAIRQVSGP